MLEILDSQHKTSRAKARDRKKEGRETTFPMLEILDSQHKTSRALAL
jgi:hypothetical protein